MQIEQLPRLAVGECRASRVLQTYNESREVLKAEFSSAILDFDITVQDIALPADALPDDILILRLLAGIQLPVGAIIEWTEGTAHGNRRRWWYVKNIIGHGTLRRSTLYHCLPCRVFDNEEGRNV